jgi:AcrR family transcriptional regulator
MRSRESWERVLEVGMDLFAERGWEGLTIAEVCRRARVSAPSIYARVDGKAGLFLAVHERWLTRIADTEQRLRVEHVRADHDTTAAATAAAAVIRGVFEEHRPVLRALIDRSAHDPQLLERGGAASRRMLATLADTIPAAPSRGRSVVRAVYAECLLRTMYGDSFLDPVDESDEDFAARTDALARTLVLP